MGLTVGLPNGEIMTGMRLQGSTSHGHLWLIKFDSATESITAVQTRACNDMNAGKNPIHNIMSVTANMVAINPLISIERFRFNFEYLKREGL